MSDQEIPKEELPDWRKHMNLDGPHMITPAYVKRVPKEIEGTQKTFDDF